MLGKASEIKVIDLDVRSVNDWLASNPNVDIIDIRFSIAWSESMGGLPMTLIIYKEGEFDDM